MSMRDACDHFVELADVRQQLAKAQAEGDEIKLLAIEGAELANELGVRLEKAKAERDEARRIAAHAGKCLMRIDAAMRINDGSKDANAAFFSFVSICMVEALLAMKDALGPSLPKPSVPTPSERGG